MRRPRWITGIGIATLLLTATAQAQIIGALEQPSGFASGIANVQGWVFTTTPGATLNQPFAVLINGVEKFKVPCCGDRGDVQSVYPDAPLYTGFSAAYNWGLEAVDNEDGQPVLVQVVVTDDQGGSAVLSTTVDLYSPTTWPFSLQAEWEETDLIVGTAEQPSATVPINIVSQCFLSNDAIYTLDAAKLSCTDLIFTGLDQRTQTCPLATFSWDRASQSFRLTGSCDPNSCRAIDQTCATDSDCCDDGVCETPVGSGDQRPAPVCVQAGVPVTCRSNFNTNDCAAIWISGIDCSQILETSLAGTFWCKNAGDGSERCERGELCVAD